MRLEEFLMLCEISSKNEGFLTLYTIEPFYYPVIRKEPDCLDELFLKQLVETQSGKLTRYVYHKTLNLEVARDIVQESFFRLTDTRRQPAREHAIPWLYSVCRNLAIDYQRKQSRWIGNGEEVIELHGVSTDPNPLDQAIRSETIDLLKSCIDQLPERHREVVVLKFESGLSYKAISKITNLSVSNVGFIIHQAVSRLRYEMVKMV